MGDLVYEPPRDGPTLWERGIPDRSAKQFCAPCSNPKYINKLYFNHPESLVMLACAKGNLSSRGLFLQ
jgi:rhamnogalacturonan endolyase